MIYELSINDFILIQHAELAFESGFNILTGETGAGKSMILGAIALVIGAQGNKDSIRMGAEKALIRATFETNSMVNQMLESYGISTEEDIIIISREISSKGKSFSRINGQLVTLTQLKTISDQLISIHGQNENQILLEKEHQLELLDAYGGEPVIALRTGLLSHYEQLKSIEQEIEALKSKNQGRFKQIDFLEYQINEIEEVRLKIDEDAFLEKEFEYLSNIEHIRETIASATSWFSGEYGEGLLSTLSQINGQLRKYENFDAKLEALAMRYKELFFMMDDLSKDSNQYLEQLELNPERFAFIEARLDTINSLKLKYGNTIESILEVLNGLKAERVLLDEIEQVLVEKCTERDRIKTSYQTLATQLTEKRNETSKAFVIALQNEFKELNMKEAQFKIEILPLNQPTPKGLDDVEFVISTNTGQPFRPLKKVVSGGELSRIMLGIKVVLGRVDEVPTLVFDEVDTGISGNTANIVGEKLARLSKNCQIICITHLPQIAVFADGHFLIEKQSRAGLTETQLRKINANEAELEIGRLVGGAELTASTTNHSREMLFQARRKKNSF